MLLDYICFGICRKYYYNKFYYVSGHIIFFYQILIIIYIYIYKEVHLIYLYLKKIHLMLVIKCLTFKLIIVNLDYV